jgi:DNA-binding MarR family transcriptional regulator
LDQVFFSLKRAHHATLGFMRPLLKRVGLTPARFDLFTALKVENTQLGLQQRLGLAKATISEMLSTLEKLGLIWRMRCGRTKVVGLTQKACELMQRAYDLALNPGHLPVYVDGVLTRFDAELDPLPERFAFEGLCARIRRAFGDRADLDLYYGWHPDDWLDAIIDPDDPEDLKRFAPQSG